MKVVRYTGHPLTILVTFSMVLISGQAFGGPFLMYIIGGLTQHTAYSVVGGLGMVMVASSMGFQSKRWNQLLAPAVALVGIFFMVFSLLLFFHHDRTGYNENTFEQGVPMTTILIFAVSALSGIVKNSIQLLQINGTKSI